MTETPATRAIDLSIEVPGTPEEVWDAVATGPGITSWFTTTQVDAEGGVAITDFGSFGKEECVITAYDAPTRFMAETRREDGSRIAAEWLVEARDGGTCIVRLVNSGFGSGQEWDTDFDGMTQGWKLFLENLRLHLTHFRGEHARAILPMSSVAGPNSEAWLKLCAALGVPAGLEVGQRFETSGDHVPKLSGVVQHVQRSDSVSDYLVVLEGERRGTAVIAAEGRDKSVMLSTWIYLYGGDPETLEAELSALMSTAFA